MFKSPEFKLCMYLFIVSIVGSPAAAPSSSYFNGGLFLAAPQVEYKDDMQLCAMKQQRFVCDAQKVVRMHAHTHT